MSEFELSLQVLGIVFLIIFIFGNNTTNNNQGIDKKVNNESKEASKLIKNIEKEQLAIENLLIQKEEYENDIYRLEFESSSDFEKEGINNTKIKKLRLKIRHLLISIDEKNNRLNELNNKLGTSMN